MAAGAFSHHGHKLRPWVGVCSAALLLAALMGSRDALAPGKERGGVVVARVEIPSGSRLIPEYLEVVQYPRNVLPRGTFPRVADNLIGRVVVSRIAPREPVTVSRLAPVGLAGGLSPIIPEGYRAMTVTVVDVVGGSGFIMPGAHGDVVVTSEPPKGSGRGDRVSKIVLQNIKLLASGPHIDQPKNDREVDRVRAVTLQVTPEQAEKLALATFEGRFQLIFRGAVGESTGMPDGGKRTPLMGGSVGATRGRLIAAGSSMGLKVEPRED